ncbi:MAG: methyltransferase domain-containing protein [Candidatus Omnitrophota bacterium]|jgi:demethylmenaquinone methyltransferase/2-methoxy-6-polyprenyl-1,4-benzoquinol methylase
MKKEGFTKTKRSVTRQWFKGWSNEYDTTLGSISFHRGLLELVARLSGVKDNDTVLDIGCGTGLLSLKLLQAADCSIVGVDSSKEMLSVLKTKIDRLKLGRNIVYKLMDASSLEFKDNSFDIVASTVTLHHLQDKLKLLKKIYKLIKPGGRLIIGEIDMDTTGKHTDINRLKRILDVLKNEWISALKEAGVEAFVRMFLNGKKHILNEGEYCISFRQWARLCRKAGFRVITIKAVPHHQDFKVLAAKKPLNLFSCK